MALPDDARRDDAGAPPPVVRRLVRADAAAYRMLMLEGYASAADAFTSTAEERAAQPLSWWEDRIDDPSGTSQAFGAFRGDALAGTVAIEYSRRAKTRHAALLIGMFVAPAHRGAGVGAALVDAAIAHARARPGVAVVDLTVRHGNLSATRLYEAAGFVAWGVQPAAIRTGDGYKAKLHMQLALDRRGARTP